MSEANSIIVPSSDPRSSLPVPDAAITTRLATMEDLPFIDGLQKMHSKQLGFFPRAQMEGYIRGGWVLVAESVGSERNALPTADCRPPTLLGYCASRDRYLKRDELGAIFQLCVVPGVQRKLIGATLLKNVFERASYGTKLYCCWCAQDLEANYFWESMGFVPLAFRTGGRGKGRIAERAAFPSVASSLRRSVAGPRVHIFWERRIRAGDCVTPYWFPSQTNAGAVREDRIVLPIPPGTHWKDVMPVILPSEDVGGESKALPGPREKKPKPAPPPATASVARGGLRFEMPKPPTAAKKEKAKREPRQKVKNDPKLIAAARELRDRWMEKVNEDPSVLESSGKYDVTRPLESGVTKLTPLLAA